MPNTAEDRSGYTLRNSNNYTIPFARLNAFQSLFFPSTLMLWNGLSNEVRSSQTLPQFKRKPNFSDQFKKIVKRSIRVGYNLDIMRQSACLVLNPITVYSYGFLFNCTAVGQASDSMTALT